MKYLKYYEDKINTPFDVLKEDIKDICLELTDIGYSISIRKNANSPIGTSSWHPSNSRFFWKDESYTFSITKNNEDHFSTDPELYFDYKDVKETIERLKDYLGKDRILSVLVLNNDEDEDGNLSVVSNRLNTEVDGIMVNSWYLYDIYSLEIEFKL